MKVYINAIFLVTSFSPLVEAFAPSIRPRQAVLPSAVFQVATEESTTAEVANDQVAQTAMPVEDPYEQFGISKDALAMGVDPNELVRWAGT